MIHLLTQHIYADLVLQGGWATGIGVWGRPLFEQDVMRLLEGMRAVVFLSRLPVMENSSETGPHT